MTQLPPELRALVAQVVRDAVRDFAPHEPFSTSPVPVSVAAAAAAGVGGGALTGPLPSGPVNAAGRSRTETVRITGNTDLQGFALRLLDVFDNPKTREDLRTGRLRFELAGGVATPAAPGAVQRIEKGAVTERKIAAAAESGTRLVLGRRAVLTPLARDKARTLGVLIEKER